MLAAAPGLILITVLGQTPIQTPVQVETASVGASDDPRQGLWSPDPQADPNLPRPAEAPSPSPSGAPGSAPRSVMPGGPRLEAPAAPIPGALQVVGQKTERRWYRWPIVINDAIFITIAAIGFALENAPIAATGTLGFSFGAPTIHWAKGNLNGGIASLAGHGFGPTVVGLLFALFGNVLHSAGCGSGSCGDFDDTKVFFVGAAVGAVAANAMDLLVLAYRDEAPGAAALRPVVRHDGDVTAFGLGGRF